MAKDKVKPDVPSERPVGVAPEQPAVPAVDTSGRPDSGKSPAAATAAKPPTRKAVVTIANTHVGVIEVEIPAAAADPRAAAIQAAKEARGIVSFGVDPVVEFPE